MSKGIVKHAGIVQRFRDGDAQKQFFRHVGVIKDVQRGQPHKQEGKGKENKHAVGQIAHPERNARAHSDQNGGDLVGASLCGTEAGQSERAAECHARADVAADECDHRRHDKGNDRADNEKAARGADAE